MNGRKITGLILIGIGVLVLALMLGHIYDPTPTIQNLSTKAGPSIAQMVKNMGAARVVYVLLVGLPILIGALLVAGGTRKKSSAAANVQPSHATAPAAKVPVAKQAGKPIVSCAVLHLNPDTRRFWQFDSRNGAFVLNREQTGLPNDPLPSSMVGKHWTSLWQRKLNVAWLPPEKVFLRVAQLPRSDFNETISMVELQLEKLSPMPVTQIVWTIHVLPHSQGNMQTVVVVLASRDAVEEFLGKLEGQGYLADDLELPILDQLQATAARHDGVYIYPEGLGGKNAGLAAWWYGGVLQNLDLITLPPENRPASLREQVTQMAWSGELEGWLTAPPSFHLVATAENAAEWEPVLREGMEQPVEIIEPLPPAQLAAATANRVARRPGSLNLLPPEYSERYQQQFIDRLWMRGLIAICGLYLLGVAIYGVALGVASFRTSQVESQVANLSSSYTNTMQIKARFSVLNDRQALKYAALDCWKTVAEHLPESVTLEQWNFSNGKRLTLHGTAPNDAVQQLLDFEVAMRRATMNVEGSGLQPLFDLNKSESLTYQGGQQANTLRWDLILELKRSEAL